MLSVPVRSVLAVLAATAKLSAPVPVPLAPAVIVNQGAFDAALHG